MAEQVDEQAETASVPAAAPNGGDIDSLLAEFDASVKPQAPEQPAPQDPPANGKANGNGESHAAPTSPKSGKSAQDLLADMQALRERAADQGERQALINFAEATNEELNLLRAERQAEIDRSDFATITENLQSNIDDVTVPDSYVRNYLLAEAELDPELARAWQNRRSEEGYGAFMSKIKQVEKKMHRELKMRPDPEATADRMAVVAAMNGGRGTPAPENNASYERRLSRMSPREYADHVEQEHGYRPNV